MDIIKRETTRETVIAMGEWMAIGSSTKPNILWRATNTLCQSSSMNFQWLTR